MTKGKIPPATTSGNVLRVELKCFYNALFVKKLSFVYLGHLYTLTWLYIAYTQTFVIGCATVLLHVSEGSDQNLNGLFRK